MLTVLWKCHCSNACSESQEGLIQVLKYPRACKALPWARTHHNRMTCSKSSPPSRRNGIVRESIKNGTMAWERYMLSKLTHCWLILYVSNYLSIFWVICVIMSESLASPPVSFCPPHIILPKIPKYVCKTVDLPLILSSNILWHSIHIYWCALFLYFIAWSDKALAIDLHLQYSV